LNVSAGVSQINKGNSAMIPTTRYPAGKAHRFTDLGGTKFTCKM
jgi:hypothetical protein